MECNRNYCDHILCDHYSSEHGYLCNECFQELIDSDLPIDEFIQTKKENQDGDYETREEYIRSIFS